MLKQEFSMSFLYRILVESSEMFYAATAEASW